MGFELVYLHSAAGRLTTTLASWLGSTASNSVVYLAAEWIEVNNMRATMICGFSAYKKILGRIETRTRDKKYLGWMRSVWDISRDDWSRIANCILRTWPDRQT